MAWPAAGWRRGTPAVRQGIRERREQEGDLSHTVTMSRTFLCEVPAVFSFSLIYVVFTHFLFPENILAVIVATASVVWLRCSWQLINRMCLSGFLSTSKEKRYI